MRGRKPGSSWARVTQPSQQCAATDGDRCRASAGGSRRLSIEPPGEPGGPLLLLVIPDLGCLCGISAVLGRWFRIDAATTGTEGLERTVAGAPRFAVIDLDLGDLDGLVLLEAIRSRGMECSVIGITAHLAVMYRAAGSPIRRLLVKPVPPSRLFRSLASLVTPLPEGPAVCARVSDPVSRAIEYVSAHYQAATTVGAIARAAGVSPSTLAHRFPAELGLTVGEYLTRVRIEVAKRLLRVTADKLDTIAAMARFGDGPHLCRVFSRLVGEPPGRYRRVA